MNTMWDWARRGAAPMAVAVAGAVALSGCTSYVNTQVTAFSAWSGSDATRTYAFVRSSAQRDSLEQATYEQWVANELDLYAFRRLPASEARYLVGLTYSTHGDTATITQPTYYGGWPGPYWGPPNPWGPFGPFGPFPAGYVSQTYPVYTHTLGIRISERATGKEVYNVTARETDGDSSLVHAMPYLVRSALADFPLGNGVVRTVRIPVGKRGGGAASNEVPVAPRAAGNAASGAAATAPR